jgi:hypothetical protein
VDLRISTLKLRDKQNDESKKCILLNQ